MMLMKSWGLSLKIWILILLPVYAFAQSKGSAEKDPYAYGRARLLNKKDDGFRGIWYYNRSLPDSRYAYKYAGGCATYPSNHYPFSVYVPQVNKTFFCFGGTDHEGKTLYHEVSYFDHTTGEVARPTIVMDKATGDAHDNPVLQIDKDGYLWLFSTAHGTGRPSFIHRSAQPYDISNFVNVHPTRTENGREVPLNNFSYIQVYYAKEKGFFALFTHYKAQKLTYGTRVCRVIACMSSKDGVHWSDWKDIGNIEQGHYQTSGKKGDRIGTSFNYHPHWKTGGGLDYRTNLYYIYTDDYGKIWRTANGKQIQTPLTTISNPALVHDYASEGLKVYINDLNYDSEGHPVILYETTKGWMPGPENGPRHWYTARWTGKSWEILPFTISDNNYDLGSLYIEQDGTWRIIAPTDAGPQPYNTGGALVMWQSKDQGHSWEKMKAMTPDCEYNQSYPRRPINANPDFYAFWSDGNGRKKSESRLYFSDKAGNVFMLPRKMEGAMAKPLPVFTGK